MTDATRKERFLDSLDRCANNDKFIPAFYSRFLESSDEIRFKFRNTDFEKQNAMLLQSLRLAAGATNGDAESLSEVRSRADTHNRKQLNIEPRFYDLWLSSVIETASEYDPLWDDSIENAWETILRHVINQMVKYY